MKNLIKILLFSVLTTSCATVFTGTTQRMTINSEPQNAKLYLNGNFVGTTPYTGSFKKSKDYNITVKKEGYVPGTAVASRSLNAVAILNLTSPISWIIDIATGALWQFDQDGFTIPLEKTKTIGQS